MKYVKPQQIHLKTHPDYNERWVHDRIKEDPALLGLGDLYLVHSEVMQPRGRLDLILGDSDSRRYTVEIQLGSSDASHIIRTLEYWDVERSRYPQYDHVAVIAAEDITSRFLNVIALLNKTIPLIAIQLRAFEVDGSIALISTRVLDLAPLPNDRDEEPETPVDRQYWIDKSSDGTMSLVDKLLALIRQTAPGTDLRYLRRHVGLVNERGLSDLAIRFIPRKNHLIASFRIPRSDDVDTLIKNSDLDDMEYNNRTGRYRIRLTGDDIKRNDEILQFLIGLASNPQPSDAPIE